MDTLQFIQKSLTERYDNTFNFYFSKDINDILRYRTHFKPFILFSQYLRADCQEQMLKRYYLMLDFQRVPMLAEYYSKQRLLEYERPLLFLTTGSKPMQKRLKKRYKKIIKLRQEQQAEQKFQNSETFLKTIKTQDINEQSQLLLPIPYNTSMDSIAHDIYEIEKSRVNSKLNSKQQSLLIPYLTIFSHTDLDHKQSSIPEYLIFDFKDKDMSEILKQYNSINLKKKSNIIQSNITNHNIPHHLKPSSGEQRLSTMSKSKKKSTKQSRKQTINNINNVKVSEQYYQGPNPNTIQYKRTININQGKASTKRSAHHDVREKAYSSVSKSSHPTARVQKIIAKQQPTGKKIEKVRTQIQKIKQINSKNKEYEDIRVKANKIQDDAVKALSKYRLKGVKSTDHLSPKNKL